MGLLTDLLGDGNATYPAPAIGEPTALPSTYTSTGAVLRDRVSLSGVLDLPAARTLSKITFEVSDVGDGLNSVRLAYAKVPADGSLAGETLTTLGSAVEITTTGIKTISGLAAALSPGRYAFYSLINGGSTAPSAYRGRPAVPSGFAGMASVGQRGWYDVVSSASYAGAMPATVPAMQTASAGNLILTLEFSA